MNEHEQIMAIIRAKNESPIPLDPHRTALIGVAPANKCRTAHMTRRHPGNVDQTIKGGTS